MESVVTVSKECDSPSECDREQRPARQRTTRRTETTNSLSVSHSQQQTIVQFRLVKTRSFRVTLVSEAFQFVIFQLCESGVFVGLRERLQKPTQIITFVSKCFLIVSSICSSVSHRFCFIGWIRSFLYSYRYFEKLSLT